MSRTLFCGGFNVCKTWENYFQHLYFYGRKMPHTWKLYSSLASGAGSITAGVSTSTGLQSPFQNTAIGTNDYERMGRCMNLKLLIIEAYISTRPSQVLNGRLVIWYARVPASNSSGAGIPPLLGSTTIPIDPFKPENQNVIPLIDISIPLYPDTSGVGDPLWRYSWLLDVSDLPPLIFPGLNTQSTGDIRVSFTIETTPTTSPVLSYLMTGIFTDDG